MFFRGLSSLISGPQRLGICTPWNSRGRSGNSQENDNFHQVYVPFLKLTMGISLLKYTCLLVYCIRSMQEHLSAPVHCPDPHSESSCTSSMCYWLHKLVLNLPQFMVIGELFVEKCAYLLILSFISCSMFLYSVYLVIRENDLKVRYRAILTLPSMFLEIMMCFLSYYATIISILKYSEIAKRNPEFYTSAFIIFAFIISIFNALLLVTHFVALYYIMIYPIHPLPVYTLSNASYSTLNYGRLRERSGGRNARHRNDETLQSVPLINGSFQLSVNHWQNLYETRGTVSSCSQIKSWNNTLRSTNTIRPRDTTIRSNEDDYLELI